MNIKFRNPVTIIILSIITFGIYSIVWAVKTKNEINSLGGKIPTAWLIIIPLMNIYFLYCYSEDFSTYVKKDNQPILWFLLFMVIPPPVGMILIQIELNKLATAPQIQPAA